MRPAAIFPILCAAVACILTILCLLAGYKKDFMEDYHMLTLNTSRIGYELVNSSTSSSSGLLSSLWNDLTSAVQAEIDEAVGSIAAELGLQDFYSWHLLDACHGTYIPGPVPNATLAATAIHKNVTGCSNRTAGYDFDPTALLNRQLHAAGLDLTLADLDWPDDVTTGLRALHVATTAAFALYCTSIGLTALLLLASVAAFLLSGRRWPAILLATLAALAALALVVASALVTAIQVEAADKINAYTATVGVEAHRGAKFLALTWAATALVLLVVGYCCAECVVGRRRRRGRGRGEVVGKEGM